MRHFIIGFLVLWLPLQGVAAAGMTACQHPGTSQKTHTSVMKTGQHAHHQDHVPYQQNQIPSLDDQSCNDCSLCYLCIASILSFAPFADDSRSATSATSFLETHFSSFIPDQPLHPPLTTAV